MRSGCQQPCFFFFFLGLLPQHIEVPRLGVQLELQLPAYARAIATWDPSQVCDLHHSSRQCRILNPLSEAIKPASSWILVRFVNHCATMGTPLFLFLKKSSQKLILGTSCDFFILSLVSDFFILLFPNIFNTCEI